jgi:hypothetical protein
VSENNPQEEAMITQGLMSALGSGLIQNTDYEAVNSLRERLKLKPIDPETQMGMLKMQQQMQGMMQPQQQGMPNVPEEE